MERFRNEFGEMAVVIATDMQPDYLTLFTEPVTQSQNTGLNFTVSAFVTTVSQVARRLNHHGVRLGAGAGTWDDMAYFCAKDDNYPKNIIIYIGDGMSAAHITAGKIALGGLNLERFAVTGLVTTHAEAD
jgi:alkaline phosphatase